MNLVIVKHDEGSGKFLFKVPDGCIVSAGDAVIVDTKYGKNNGIALCNNFVVTDDIADILIRSFGTNISSMRYVLCKATMKMFDVPQE